MYTRSGGGDLLEHIVDLPSKQAIDLQELLRLDTELLVILLL